MELRQFELRRQMTEAFNSGEKELFAFLKGQWVHRYGVDTLPSNDDLELTEHDQESNQDQMMNEGKKLPSYRDDLIVSNNTFEKIEDKPLLDEKEKSAVSKKTMDLKDIAPDGDQVVLDEKEKSVVSKKTMDLKDIDPNAEKVLDKSSNSNLKKNFVGNSKITKERQDQLVQPIMPKPPLPRYNYLKKWLY